MYFSRPAKGKAPPVIASLDHLPTAWGGLFAAACRGRACPARDLTDIAIFRFVSFFILLCRQVSSPLHGGQRAGRPTNSRLRQRIYPSRGVATICGASGTPPPRLLSSLFAAIYSPQQFLRCYPVQLRQRQQVCRAGVCAAVLPFGDRLTADA